MKVAERYNVLLLASQLDDNAVDKHTLLLTKKWGEEKGSVTREGSGKIVVEKNQKWWRRLCAHDGQRSKTSPRFSGSTAS
jgi:hypothetical protein